MGSDSSRGSAALRRGSLGSEALQKLKRGEITVEEYLDAQVEQSLARLGALVTEEERHLLREVLREEMASDPSLHESLRRLTGAGHREGSK